MLKRFVLVIVIAIVLGLVPTNVNAQDEDISFEVTQTPCPVEPALSEVEGETVICGTTTVPENYDDPEAGQIDLAFAVLRSSSLSPAPDPVIYLHGGPGAAELRGLGKMTERFAPIRQNRDVIIFDQRGTGYSNERLTCEVEYATQQDDVREAIKEYAGKGVSVDEEFAVNMTIFQACLDRFEEIGTDLTQYNTINNARDVVNVASALGYDEFNLYGFSYGTQLALEVMRQAPEGLRGVILDSVAPPDIKLYENLGQPNVEAMLSLFAICANDEACNAAYPDLQNRFEALLAQLNDQPLTADDGSLVTANTVIGALRQSDIRPGLGAYFPLMIWELEREVLDTLNAIRNNELPPAPPDSVDPVARRYAGLDVSEDAQFLIQTALDLREESRQLDKTADRLLERGNERIEVDLVGNSLAARFDLLFHEIMNNEPFDRRLALNQAYLVLPVEGSSVEDVQSFITEHFDGVNAARLMALADAMTHEDVAELAQIIFGKARDHAYFFDVQLALSLYACQEHVPYNTLDGMLAAFESLVIPQLGAAKLGTAQNLIASCQLFPTGLEPDSFHEPIASDIPTLILLGSADTQTAISWGQHAAETLDNSQVVLLPETGHGAIRFSRCAKDVGAAFFNNPEAEIDTACTEDLLPQFVLPPEDEGQP